MEEILPISQQPNERLRVLAEWIKDATHKYWETLALLATDLDRLIKSWFKHPIADQEKRNQLLWDRTGMTLDQMVQKAQQFKNLKNSEPVKSKKSLRMTDSSSETTVKAYRKATETDGYSVSWEREFVPIQKAQFYLFLFAGREDTWLELQA